MCKLSEKFFRLILQKKIAMINFELSIPTKIIFGRGKIERLATELKNHGKRVLLAYGGNSLKKSGLYDKISNILTSNDIWFCELSGIKPNPSIKSVREGIRICREEKIDIILGAGGGSVIDCIKAIAAGVHYQGNPWDFFTGKARIGKVLPVAAILTLAATGSESNGGCVITNEETEEKLPFVHPSLKPVFSILDPENTFSVPPHQTAAGTADIMSHCIEQYFSKAEETFVQDRLTEAILKTCIHYGPIAMKEPENYHARANLMWASTLALNGILAAGKEGDWATHMIEHKVSAVNDLTHGTGLAIITPHWMTEVLSPENADKFVDFAVNVFHVFHDGDKLRTAREGIRRLSDFFRLLKIPASLSEAGFAADEKKLSRMAEDIVKYGPVGRFKQLDKNAVLRILKAAY